MQANCLRSCGACREREEEREDCEDNSEHTENCPIWRESRYCVEGTYESIEKITEHFVVDSLFKIFRPWLKYCQFGWFVYPDCRVLSV